MAKLEIKAVEGKANLVRLYLDGHWVKNAKRVELVFEARQICRAKIELYPTEVIVDPDIEIDCEVDGKKGEGDFLKGLFVLARGEVESSDNTKE